MEEVAAGSRAGIHGAGQASPPWPSTRPRLDRNYWLNTVDICPVGALTSNDFRFRCASGSCGDEDDRRELRHRAQHDGGTGTPIYRVTPRENNEVNSCWMPDTHRLNFHDLQSEARLTEPLVKENGLHRPATWEEAITAGAAGLRQHPADETAVILSGRMTNEELFLLRLLAETLGIGQGDMVARMGQGDGYLIAADRNPNTEGVKQVMEMPAPGNDLWSLREAVRAGRIKALMVLHENLLAEAGFNEADLAKLDVLVAVDILANPTAAHATVVLPGAGFAEKSGSMINVTGRLQRLNQAIPPPGQARADWRILRDLVAACGGEAPFDSVPGVFAALAGTLPAFQGRTFGSIGDLGVQLYETGVGFR